MATAQHLQVTTYQIGMGESTITAPAYSRVLDVRSHPMGAEIVLLELRDPQLPTSNYLFRIVAENDPFEDESRFLHHIGSVVDAEMHYLHVFAIAPPGSHRIYNSL